MNTNKILKDSQWRKEAKDVEIFHKMSIEVVDKHTEVCTTPLIITEIIKERHNGTFKIK